MNETLNHDAPPEHGTKLLRGPLWWRLLKKFILVGLITGAVLFGLSMFSSSPTNLGVNNGQLAPCPDTPNCVSSFSTKETQMMDPIKFWSGNGDDTLAVIKQTVLENFEDVKTTSESEDYIHFEFTSSFFRFVDDVEFLLDEESELVHFRSASRVGRSDLGVNRSRMKKITELLAPPEN